MNTDFRLNVGIFGHSKFVKLRRRLGEAGALALIQLLSYTAVNRPDGALLGMDDDDIAIAAGWQSDPASFVMALRETGWLDNDPENGLCVHDWAEHNPWAAGAPTRSESARHAADTRWQREREEKERAATEDAVKLAKNQTQPLPFVPSAHASNAPDTPSASIRNAPAMPEQCAPHQSAMPSASIRNAPILSYPILSDSSPSPSEGIATTTLPETSRARPPDHPPPGESGPTAGDDQDCTEEVVALLLAQGISEVSARELLHKRSCQTIRLHVSDLPERIAERRAKGKETDDPAGLLFKAILEGWSRPATVQRRVAEEETRRRGVETARRQAQERERAEAAEQMGRERLAEAWEALAQEEKDDIAAQEQAGMLKVQPWRGQHEKAPDEFWERERPRKELLRRCHSAVAERGHVPAPEPVCREPEFPREA